MRAFLILPLLALAACRSATAPGTAADTARTGYASPVTGVIARSAGDPTRPQVRPFRGMTADSEVVYGDPDAEGGPFVIRIRELAGGIVPPHSHPVDEHITVLQGTWWFGTGDTFERARLTPLPAGSYAFAPKGTTMFGYAPEATVVQVHGVGPFHIHWRNGMRTLDDVGAAGAFRFRKGETVRSPRGEGRIRQGYASGELVQYEVEGAAGLFVAQEAELQR